MWGWLPVGLGLLFFLGGSFVAQRVQTTGGVTLREMAIPASTGLVVRRLLHVPAGATPARPAPAVLAAHGFANTREIQDPFAMS